MWTVTIDHATEVDSSVTTTAANSVEKLLVASQLCAATRVLESGVEFHGNSHTDALAPLDRTVKHRAAAVANRNAKLGGKNNNEEKSKLHHVLKAGNNKQNALEHVIKRIKAYGARKVNNGSKTHDESRDKTNVKADDGGQKLSSSTPVFSTTKEEASYHSCSISEPPRKAAAGSNQREYVQFQREQVRGYIPIDIRCSEIWDGVHPPQGQQNLGQQIADSPLDLVITHHQNSNRQVVEPLPPPRDVLPQKAVKEQGNGAAFMHFTERSNQSQMSRYGMQNRKHDIKSQHNGQSDATDASGDLSTGNQGPSKDCSNQIVRTLQRSRDISSLNAVEEQDTREVCVECAKSFTNKHRLLAHIHQVHKPVRCPSCDRTTRGKYNFHKHWKSEHLGVAEYCPFCSKLLSREKVFENRLKHKKASTTKCGNRSQLLAKLMGFTQCRICKKIYSTPGNLRRHFITKHFDHENPNETLTDSRIQ